MKYSTTVTNYVKEYQEGGIEAIKKVNFYQPKSELCAYQSTLEAHFKDNPPVSVKEAMEEIEMLTGIRRSPNRIRIYMRKLGLKFRKVGMIPTKMDVEKHEEFIINNLEPKLAEAKEE